jgi:glucokinase
VSRVAGVDVGGTKIDACVIDDQSGQAIERIRIPTRPERGGAAVLADCVDLVARLADETPFAGIGIGLCELVSPGGVPTSAATIDWRGLDVAGAFAEIAPALLESDVRAGALAEARFGAGRGVVAPWVYVTVGTGISFSLVVAGWPFAGARGNALILGAPPVERVASGRALERRAAQPSAEGVLADETFAPLVNDAARALGHALAALVNALDPDRIVVAGGLGLVDGYRDTAVRAMRPLIEADDTRDLPVVPAALGTLAGPLGAALAAAGRLQGLPANAGSSPGRG